MTDDGVDARILGPGLLPTPFTADEIREGCPDGRLIRLLVEVDGQEPFIRTNHFIDGDDEGSTLESQRLALDGTPISDRESTRVTWRQLQAHASFPADTTTRTEETLDIEIGSLECLRYTAVDGSEVSTFWFARSMPGMPVRYQAEAGGRVVNRVTMIENRLP